MRFFLKGSVIAGGIALASVGTASADTLWIYGGGQSLYSTVQISDTQNIQPPFTDAENDTAYAISDTTIGYHFNWGYQFTGHNVPETTALALYGNTGIDSGLSSGKGWAAFKLTWKHRDFTWDVRPYNTLMIKHKSALSYHKADIYFGQCAGTYDSAQVDSIGTIPASNVWTTTSIPIPPPSTYFNTALGYSDSALRQYMREVRFIMHNVPPRTDSTSPQDSFCLDEVGLTRMAWLASPVNNAHSQPSQVTLSWGSVPGATSYTAQVSETSTFATTIFSQSGLTAPAATVSGLESNTTYYWRANVSDSLSTNAWSAAWQFSTVTTSSSSSKHCGCGSGTAVAFLPPLWFKLRSSRRRRKKQA